MKDITAIVRRIDQEIDTHRKEIFMRQALVTQLEDSRKLFMRMTEDDIARAEMARQDQQHLFNGSHAAPKLIVRPTGADAPQDIMQSGKREGLPRLKAVRKDAGKKKGPRKNGDSELGRMRERILGFLKPGDEPVASGVMANHFGMSAEGDARKSLQNALYHMRVKGMLLRDDDGRYYRPAEH